MATTALVALAAASSVLSARPLLRHAAARAPAPRVRMDEAAPPVDMDVDVLVIGAGPIGTLLVRLRRLAGRRTPSSRISGARA